MNTLLLLTSCLAIAGCAAAATTSPTTGPALDKRFAISIADAKATWTARVNTGGWALTTDRVVVEGATVKVFATLERPGEGEMVGQAFATLTGEAPADGATAAELSVRQTRRGEAADVRYVVVARTGG